MSSLKCIYYLQMRCLTQLLQWVCKADNSKLTSVAFRHFSRYLSRLSIGKFVTNLDKVIGTLSAEEQMIIWQFIFQFLEAQGTESTKQLLTLKPRTLETLTSLLGAKTAIPSWVSKNWSYVIKTYSCEDFNEALMPILQRQMLRSPEIIIVSK